MNDTEPKDRLWMRSLVGPSMWRTSEVIGAALGIVSSIVSAILLAMPTISITPGIHERLGEAQDFAVKNEGNVPVKDIALTCMVSGKTDASSAIGGLYPGEITTHACPCRANTDLTIEASYRMILVPYEFRNAFYFQAREDADKRCFFLPFGSHRDASPTR